MTMIVLMIVAISIALIRALYMARVHWIEYTSLAEDEKPSVKSLVWENFESWAFLALAKLVFLTGAIILAAYGDFDQASFDPSNPLDYVVPSFVLGFIILVGKEERRIYTRNQRYKMLGRGDGDIDNL